MGVPRLGTLVYAVALCLLVCGCGSGASGPGRSSVDGNSPQRPLYVSRTFSDVDGMELSAVVHTPEDYDNSHLRPLIVVLPGVDFPESPLTGQALVALLENSRPPSCPEWIVERDIQCMVRYLVSNHAVDPRHVFLMGAGFRGVSFAAHRSVDYSGVLLTFTDGDDFSLEGLPLENLLNLPIWLDKSQGAMPSPAAIDLELRLKVLGHASLHAPDMLLASPDRHGMLASAFSWLSAQDMEPGKTIHWSGEELPEELLWLRVDEPNRRGIRSSVTAELIQKGEGRVELRITTRNVRSFSIQSSWGGYSSSRGGMLLDVNGQLLGVSQKRGWISLENERASGRWQLRRQGGESPFRPTAPISRIFARPCLIVVGTLDGNRADAWRAAADNLAAAWGRSTGISPRICKDTDVTDETLAGHNLILLGSGADNSLSKILLDANPLFLRNLFQTIPEEARVDDGLSVVTLLPGDEVAPGGQVAVIVANGVEAIDGCWAPLAQQVNADYVISSPVYNRAGFYE